METDVRTTKKKKKKRKKSRSGIKIAIIVLSSILVLVSGVFAYLYFDAQNKEQLRQNILESGVFREGVSIGGVDVSGMAPAEARAALAPVEQQINDNIYFNFVCDGKSYQADSSYFDIAFNTEQAIEEALKLARSGDLASLQAELQSIKTEGRSYDLEYTVAPTRVEAFLHTFADALTTEAVPASVAVKALPIKEDTKAQAAINISLPKDGSITDKRDLFFDFVSPVDGYGIDIEAVMEEVTRRTADKDFGDLAVAMTNIPSEITVDSLKENLVLRSSAFTSYKSTRSNANRVFNLKKATGLVYGTAIQPGEEFSANTILGDRYEKYGWMMAPAVIGGGAGTEDQPGGGVCQISTTIYNAALKGDLEITYRRNHSSRSGYIDGGLDATINTGTIDFTWKNNTASPVYVFIWVDTSDYTVVCELYGEPFPDTFDTIELSSELVETIPAPETVYEVQSWITAPYWMKYKSAKDGYIYQSYATYKKNGAVVETKPIATSKYNAHSLTYYVWPGFLAGSGLDPAYEIVKNQDGSTALANPGLLSPPVSDAQVQ